MSLLHKDYCTCSHVEVDYLRKQKAYFLYVTYMRKPGEKKLVFISFLFSPAVATHVAADGILSLQL